MRQDVTHAAEVVRDRYFDPLTLEELAASVYISPFHFCRVFAAETGLTPGRFITAVRFYEAKQLLLTTSLAIADVVCTVGYSSVGTFTTRFIQEVGMRPSEYRNPALRRSALAVSPAVASVPASGLDESSAGTAPVIEGPTSPLRLRVDSPVALRESVTGVFSSATPQSAPVASASTTTGDNLVEDVPAGSWHVITVGTTAAEPGGEPTLFIGRTQVDVAPEATSVARVSMRSVQVTDAPFLVLLDPRTHQYPSVPASSALRARAA